MTEQNTTPAESSTEVDPDNLSPADELKMLKDRAKVLGIPLGGNIGVEALRRKIETKLAGDEDKDMGNEEVDEELQDGQPEAKARPMTKAERQQATRARLQREKMALVRCRIYNLNPSKRDLQGEIITVANKYLGTVRKFIPFGEATDGGYHIPRVIYDDLKSRKFQQIRTHKAGGKIEVDTRMVPEYSIEVLDPLTQEELEALATKQAAAERLGSE